ncbi:MAG: ABC transporter ATP-binding protein [Candidatus Bipolaricaulaceae bacterium]
MDFCSSHPEEEPSAAVVLKGVRKTYVVRERTGLFRPPRRREIPALRGVDLAVERGEFLALLGRNGAGKTTLLKIVSTLLLPTAGEVRVEGYDAVRQPKEVRRRIGVVLSGERTLYWKLTGLENLLLFGGLYNLPRREAKARAQELLALVGLSPFAHVSVEKYSTGMRKRLSIARALMHRPSLLILDEPTAGLDPQGTAELWQILRDLRAERRITVLMATHNMLEAEVLPDRLVILEEGRIVAEGSPAAIKERAGAQALAVITVAGGGIPPDLFGPEARVLAQDERGLVAVPARHLPQALAAAQAQGLRIENVQVKDSTLWDAFLRLTGRPFDDLGETPKGGEEE